jgi:hypothetical protein
MWSQRWRFVTVAAALALPIVCFRPSDLTAAGYPRPVAVRFVKSALADYLVYLVGRGTGGSQFKAVEQAVPLADIPPLEENISLAGLAASLDVRNYKDLQPLLEPYRTPSGRVIPVDDQGETRYQILAYSFELPAYESLSRIIALGESRFQPFEAFWRQEVEPVEEQKIREWREQLDATKPLDLLQVLARLPFPSPTLDIVVMGMHGAGSANTYPAAIYTGVRVRNVAWAIGHEATHLLVDEYAGAKWLSRPRAAEAIRLITEAGGQKYEIEEALALLMQARVSAAAGFTPSDYRVSANFTDPSPKRAILVALEDGWDAYRQSDTEDLIDFMLDRAVYALTKPKLQ